MSYIKITYVYYTVFVLFYKQDMNGYPDWIINSIPTIHPSLESTTCVYSYDTSDRHNNQETHQ